MLAIGKKASRPEGPMRIFSEPSYHDHEPTEDQKRASGDDHIKKPDKLNLTGYGTFPWNFRPATLKSTMPAHPKHKALTAKAREHVPLLDDGEAQNDNDSGEASTHADDDVLEHDAFCKLIGMNPKACTGSGSADLEAGGGLYHDVHRSYISAMRWHYWFEVGVYTALLSQVLLSANFIVLGAMRGDHHVQIAVLGAVSVGIAGCLALIKGQGLPMRIRIERDALWEVQLEAEELHWRLAAGGIVKFSDVKRIWSRYVQVERDSSLNHPDTWTSSANQAAQGMDVTQIATGTAPNVNVQAVSQPGTALPATPGTAPPMIPGSVIYTTGGGLRQPAMEDDGIPM